MGIETKRIKTETANTNGIAKESKTLSVPTEWEDPIKKTADKCDNTRGRNE